MAVLATRSPADEILHVLLGTEEGREDPYLLYRALRDIAPLFRSELDGHWYSSRYDDCKVVLVDPRAGRGPGMVTRYGQTWPASKKDPRPARPHARRSGRGRGGRLHGRPRLPAAGVGHR